MSEATPTRSGRRCHAQQPGTPLALMRCAGFTGKPEGEWQHAKECRGLAKRSRSLEHREMLLNIAATWESLANDRIKTAEGLERIANLEKAARKSRKNS